MRSTARYSARTGVVHQGEADSGQGSQGTVPTRLACLEALIGFCFRQRCAIGMALSNRRAPGAGFTAAAAFPSNPWTPRGQVSAGCGGKRRQAPVCLLPAESRLKIRLFFPFFSRQSPIVVILDKIVKL